MQRTLKAILDGIVAGMEDEAKKLSGDVERTRDGEPALESGT
jgi:hypothetical protein